MQQTFNIEEIKNYILMQNSLGDVLSNLSVDNIIKANEDKQEREDIFDTISETLKHKSLRNIMFGSEE